MEVEGGGGGDGVDPGCLVAAMGSLQTVDQADLVRQMQRLVSDGSGQAQPLSGRELSLFCSHKIQWRPILMRAFQLNDIGLFFTHPHSLTPHFLLEGKRQAGTSHLNEKFSFE